MKFGIHESSFYVGKYNKVPPHFFPIDVSKHITNIYENIKNKDTARSIRKTQREI
jgi:hypothetical protein